MLDKLGHLGGAAASWCILARLLLLFSLAVCTGIGHGKCDGNLALSRNYMHHAQTHSNYRALNVHIVREC